MLRVLDRSVHATRLRRLIDMFRRQEAEMRDLLLSLQAELEHWHREAAFRRLDSAAVDTGLLDRCSDLQQHCDALATELVHVRLAILGAGEELADEEGRMTNAGRHGSDAFTARA
jgi:hypothetical protein